MSDFKAKMHKINSISAARASPYIPWGAYSAPPKPLAVFNGPTSKGRAGEDGGEGKGGTRSPKYCCLKPPLNHTIRIDDATWRIRKLPGDTHVIGVYGER